MPLFSQATLLLVMTVHDILTLLSSAMHSRATAADLTKLADLAPPCGGAAHPADFGFPSVTPDGSAHPGMAHTFGSKVCAYSR